MPGFNRRGPQDGGAMTGRKMGRCNPDNKGKTEEEILQERDTQDPKPGLFHRLRIGFGKRKGLGRGSRQEKGSGMHFRGGKE